MDEKLRKMAEECGLDRTHTSDHPDNEVWEGYRFQLEAFARAVAEDCAKLADDMARNPNLEKFEFYHAQKAGIELVANTIRARYSP